MRGISDGDGRARKQDRLERRGTATAAAEAAVRAAVYSGLLLYSDGPPRVGVEHDERTLPPLPLPVQRQRSTPTDG